MTPSLPLGRIKQRAEDFVVEELPAYAPSGTGEHVFVRFTKTDRTTLDTLRAITHALQCDARAAGFAGMKDRRGRTTQTISIHTPRGTTPHDLAARAASPRLDGVELHDAIPARPQAEAGAPRGEPLRHRRAIRSGQSRRRRSRHSWPRSPAKAYPNAFGAQSFGTRGDNADRARAWLRGEERGPRDPRMQRLLWSSLQSAVFNAVLACGSMTAPGRPRSRGTC